MEEPDHGLARVIADATFRQYAKTFLRIEDQRGVIVPFELNEAQIIVDNEVERQIAAGRPIRVLVLKGRQQGVSTYAQGRLAHRALTQRTRALTVGHVLPAVHELWSKLDRFWKEIGASDFAKQLAKAGITLQPPLEPGMGDKGRRTVFADPLGSVCRYDSAADPESVGRGMTVHMAHLTEIPQWSKPDETMQAVLATISNDPSTMIFVETTAKGASGWFFDTWIKAMNDVSRGIEPEFYPVFVEWWHTQRYARKRRPGEHALERNEKAFRDKYSLTNEQCYWYRDQRSIYGERVVEEFPSNWQEAFLSSGLPYFLREVMKEYRESTRPADRVGSFRLYDGLKAIWEKQPGAPTHIFEDPQEGHRYAAGLDFASGRAKDFNTIVVIDVDTLRVVATHKSKWLPDQMLDEAVCLGKIFNMALLVPERNGIGQALVDRLTNDIGYRNVYRERDPTRVKYHKGTRYGWVTSTGTRKGLLEGMARLVHRREVYIPCERLLGEMDTFVFTDSEGEHAEAGDGANDDLVLAFAFALKGAASMPAASNDSKQHSVHRPTVSNRTGY